MGELAYMLYSLTPLADRFAFHSPQEVEDDEGELLGTWTLPAGDTASTQPSLSDLVAQVGRG